MKPFAAVMKATAITLVVVQVLLQVAVSSAQARMVGTEACLIATQEATDNRMRIQSLLNREDVQEALASQGVSITEARARIAALTDKEVQEIAGQLDQLPAGGDAVGAVIGAILIIFLVLLITDLLGYTNVFPFVNRIR